MNYLLTYVTPHLSATRAFQNCVYLSNKENTFLETIICHTNLKTLFLEMFLLHDKKKKNQYSYIVRHLEYLIFFFFVRISL